MYKKIIIPEDKKAQIEEVKYSEEVEKGIQETVEESLKQVGEKKELTQLIKEQPLLVLITGGAASGKTTLTKQIKECLGKNQQEVVVLSIDSYYSYSPLLFQSRNPILHQIFRWEELNKDLESLLAGKSIYLPTYDDSVERQFKRTNVLVKSTPVIIVEGMLALFDEEIRKKSNLKVYLEVKDEIRLERRLERYKKGLEEGKFQKPIEYEIERFNKGRPKENQEIYVEPTKKYADLVVNNDSFEGNVERVVETINKQTEKTNP